jgi:hypothetical protein
MGVGNEDGVNTSEGMRHNLLAEIRSAIDKYSGLFGLNEGRTAQTLVVRIWAGAGVTLTADGRDAARSSCSKKCQTHSILNYELHEFYEFMLTPTTLNDINLWMDINAELI